MEELYQNPLDIFVHHQQLSVQTSHHHVCYLLSVCTGPCGKYVFLLQINLGTTVTMTSGGRQAAEGQRQPSHGAGQSDQQAAGQTLPLPSNGTSHQQGQGGPRVIRITHQTMEPVVMMQMNIDGTCADGMVSLLVKLVTCDPAVRPGSTGQI